MARLDESTLATATVAQHLSDHNQLHAKANYVYDVTDYGATGDGSTDDTAAIQAAVDAADTALGGTVSFPAGTYVFTAIDLDQKKDITLSGVGGSRNGNSVVLLKYNLSGSADAISAYGSTAILIENMLIVYTSATYTGKLVNYDGDNTNVTSFGTIRNAQLSSTVAASTRSAVLLSLNGTHTMQFNGVTFSGADVCVSGVDGTTVDDYANAVTFTSCTFANAATAQVDNPGESWSFVGCVFEAVDGNPRAVRTNISSSKTRALSFYSCWFGDDNIEGNWIEWNGLGFTAIGNTISVDQAGSSFLKLTASSKGVFITGSYTRDLGWLVDDTTSGTSEGVVVIGNVLRSLVDVFKGGTVPDGAVYHDTSGNVVIAGDSVLDLGKLSLTSSVSVSGLANGVTFLTILPSGSSVNKYALFTDGSMSWGDGTNAADVTLNRYTTGVLGVKDSLRVAKDFDHAGTKAGFYGTTPVTQQTGVAVSAAGVHAALVNLGLITA